jgi:hypothetical protein
MARMSHAAILDFLEAQASFDALRRSAEAGEHADTAAFNRELLDAYHRLESLARVVAGVDEGLKFAVPGH